MGVKLRQEQGYWSVEDENGQLSSHKFEDCVRFMISSCGIESEEIEVAYAELKRRNATLAVFGGAGKLLYVK